MELLIWNMEEKWGALRRQSWIKSLCFLPSGCHLKISKKERGPIWSWKHMCWYIYSIQVYFGSSLHSCWDSNQYRQRYNTEVGQLAIREEGPCGVQQFTGCYLSSNDATAPNFNFNSFLILAILLKAEFIENACRCTNVLNLVVFKLGRIFPCLHINIPAHVQKSISSGANAGRLINRPSLAGLCGSTHVPVLHMQANLGSLWD